MRTMNQEKVERLADFIHRYARYNNGSSPSLSEIMEYMSMSRSTAYRYILELEKVAVDTGLGIYENIQNGTRPQKQYPML